MYFLRDASLFWNKDPDPADPSKPAARGKDRCVTSPIERVGPAAEGLAICYAEDGVLLKHGSPDRVRAWRDEAGEAYRARLGMDLVVFETPATPEGVDLVNRCIATTGLVETLMRRGELPVPARIEEDASPSP